MTKLFFALVTTGPLTGRKYVVNTDTKIIIGRGKKVDIDIDSDDYCSRKHALLYWVNKSCFIEDLNSTNGTYLNHKKISGKKELKNEDIIGLGATNLLIGIKDSTDNSPGDSNK